MRYHTKGCAYIYKWPISSGISTSPRVLAFMTSYLDLQTTCKIFIRMQQGPLLLIWIIFNPGMEK